MGKCQRMSGGLQGVAGGLQDVAHLIHRGHAFSCSLVGEVQGPSDDSDLIMGQVAAQPLLQAVRVHQSLQLCPPEQSLHPTSGSALLVIH